MKSENRAGVWTYIEICVEINVFAFRSNFNEGCVNLASASSIARLNTLQPEASNID